MELEVFPPFSIHDAEFALYRADFQGNAISGSGGLFLGGKIESLEPSAEFTKMRLDRHGDALGANYYSDEEHRFTVKNLWVMSRAAQPANRVMPTPSFRRNQQYVFVIRWLDPETQCWALRTYYGVTADGHRLTSADEIFHQELPFSARRMTELSGYLQPPSLAPVTTGFIRYISAAEDTAIYSYDFNSKVYTPIDPALLPGRASISIAADLLQVLFDAEIALRATNETGVHVTNLSAVGGTFPLGAAFPRIEFWIGASRVAAVTAAGELAVPEINEVTSHPGLTDPAFEFSLGGTWCLTVAQGAAYLKSISDDLS